MRVANHQLLIDGQPHPVRGAMAHYWRLEPDVWPRVLDAIVESESTAVTTYIPWEVHETAPGQYDFGEHDPHKNVHRFFTLCEERGLDVIARPGPQINAELTWFGYPRRIVTDRSLHALSAAGAPAVLTQVPKPIPALSYANDVFFTEVANWYDAVCPILVRHLRPEGRLLAVQVDNELAFFFNVNAWTADYSPAAIDRYRAFLAEKYGAVISLNTAYHTSYESFDEIDPPRRFDGAATHDVPRYLDWAHYRERYLVDAIARLAGMLRERGLTDVPLFHNYPHPLGAKNAVHGLAAPFNLPALERKVDFVGFDIYARRDMYDYVRTLATYVVGSSRYPFVPELVAGVWPWYQNPGDGQDEEFTSKAVLMHGIKGFSRYMFVERNKWLGSPVRRDGSIREDRFHRFHTINAALARYGWERMRRRADVLLLANRDYHRLASTAVLVTVPGDFLETPTGFSEYPDELTLSEETLGFAEPVQLVDSQWYTACAHGLSDANFSYIASDTDAPTELWPRYRAVVLSTYEYLNSSVSQAIVDYVTGGGVVVIGPRIPHLDTRMHADQTLRAAIDLAQRAGDAYRIGDGAIVHLTDLSNPREVLENALAEFNIPRMVTNDTRLEVTVHSADDEPDHEILFVANPSEEPIDARVELPRQPSRVVHIWSGELVDVTAGGLQKTMPPLTIDGYDCIGLTG